MTKKYIKFETYSLKDDRDMLCTKPARQTDRLGDSSTIWRGVYWSKSHEPRALHFLMPSVSLCDVVCEKVPYCGTNIEGPYQTRIMGIVW